MAAEDYFDIDGDPYGPEFDNDTPDYTPPYEVCPKCGARLVRRARKRDGHPFMGCAKYPNCNFCCGIEDTLEYHLKERRRKIQLEIKNHDAWLADIANQKYHRLLQRSKCIQELAEVEDEMKRRHYGQVQAVDFWNLKKI